MTPLRWLAAAALASIAAASGAQPARPSIDARADALRARLELSCAEELEAARKMFRSRAYSFARPATREHFAAALAECAVTQDEGELARTAAERAGARGKGILLLAEISLAADEGRARDARMGLEQLARDAPQLAARLDESTLWTIYFAIHELNDPAELLAFHEAVFAAGLRPRQASDAALLRREHATLLLDRKEFAQARKRLEGELTAGMVVLIRIDTRFDPLRTDAEFERRLDVRHAAEQDVARARAALAADPRRLEVVLELSAALRTLGRSADAREVAERALQLDEQSDEAHFVDRDERLNQLLDQLAMSLYELGRTAEAHDAYERAIVHGEHGGENVSQRIDFAIALVDEGELERALATLAPVEQASMYGEMWVAAARACAYARLGPAAKLREALSFLVANERGNQAARLRGLLCADELDLAADLLIRRLADPEQRASALEALQIYQDPPHTGFPLRATLLDRLARLRDRDDVQHALLEVGRIEQIPLPSNRFGDI